MTNFIQLYLETRARHEMYLRRYDNLLQKDPHYLPGRCTSALGLLLKAFCSGEKLSLSPHHRCQEL